jgi:dsRNA-specific ribonuclease
MDEARKQQLLNLLRSPVFNIDTPDAAALDHYDQALTHSSYVKEQRDQYIQFEDNERLEFFWRLRP